jgi:hypothetical protein
LLKAGEPAAGTPQPELVWLVTAAVITVEPECVRYSIGRNPECLGYHDRTRIDVFNPDRSALSCLPRSSAEG